MKKKWILGALALALIISVISVIQWLKVEETDITTLSTQPTLDTLYDTDTQTAIQEEITQLKSTESYTIDNPLWIKNPYGTNTTSVYVYFETEEAAIVSYNIHVNDTDIPDFSGTVSETYTTEHEYQLIGLIPDVENIVTLTLLYEDGSSAQYNYSIQGASLQGEEELKLEKTEGDSSETASDGLYTILGNDYEDNYYMYYYDNDGILRGEIPILDYLSVRLLFQDDAMYVTISEEEIAEINSLGQVTQVYNLGDYRLHHDFVFDSDYNLLILATDTNEESIEDHVISLNRETGEIDYVLDMADLMDDYKQTTGLNNKGNWDWMHMNTIQWMDEGSIILSSRETSTIIKIKDLYTNPTIDYFIADESVWEDTEYASYVYEKGNNFYSQAGQHSVTYEEDDSLEDGQYYLYMFNNNFGISSTNDNIDWTTVDGVVTDSTDEDAVSYYYKYLVDENTQTYTLVDSFELPFSGYVSSVQDLENTTVINSGTGGVFQEYDSDHTLIQSFEIGSDNFIYRVYKYDFEGFYFY